MMQVGILTLMPDDAGWYPKPGEHPVEDLGDPEVVWRKEIEKRLKVEEAAAASVRAELDPSGIA